MINMVVINNKLYVGFKVIDDVLFLGVNQYFVFVVVFEFNKFVVYYFVVIIKFDDFG